MPDPTLRDPGPMARFAEMVAEVGCMDVIVQRLTDAQTPETLEDIAKSRQVPYGRLSAWITESRERTEQYENAMRVRAELLAQQTIEIADTAGVTKGEQGKAKLRIDTRFKYAAAMKPETYGSAQNVNVNVKDLRTPTERDALVLEAARGVAFLLHAGAKLKEGMQSRVALPAPTESEEKVVSTSAKGPI